MTDYERGVEQASNIYKEVIREYVAENTRLRELVKEFVANTRCEGCPCRHDCDHTFCVNDFSYHTFAAIRELGIEEYGQ